MRISYVQIAGFRGFKNMTRFDFPSGFVVLTGRNGAGKSTVLDALDYAVTGTINKYNVKEAKGGGLDSHIWWMGEGAASAHYVEIGFVSPDGREVRINRSRDHGLQSSLKEVRTELCLDGISGDSWPETLMRTTLIRDETLASLSLDLPEQARFEAVRAAMGGLTGPDHTGRTGELLKAAHAAKSVQEARLNEAQAELGRSLSELTEARSIADRQSDVSEAEQIIRLLVPDLAKTTAERPAQLRRRIAERKQSVASLMDVIAKVEFAIAEENFLASDAGIATARTLADRVEALERSQDQLVRELAEADRAAATENEADAFAAHMVALLDHGEKVGLVEGHCPLCAAARSDIEFARAIEQARARISARGRAAARVLDQRARTEVAVHQNEELLRAARDSLLEFENRRHRVIQELSSAQAVLQQHRLQADPLTPAVVRRLVLNFQETTAQLEHALFILEASGAHDRVTALEDKIALLRANLEEESLKLAATLRAVESAKQIDTAAKSVANQILAEQFDTVLPLLKELYLRLRPHTDWKEIETDFGGKVRASLNFTVGDGKNPQFLFSSGQRRAAGLAFLLAVHLSRPWCRLHSLLLDDPVQHIDDYRALNLVEVLSAIRRMGRQVIVAVEDHALADLLCRRLRSTARETGCRFDLSTGLDGSARIETTTDVFPMPAEVLQLAEAS